MAPVLAFLGLHLKPPVRQITRDATAVEARTLARANRFVLRALARDAGGGPIGRAALSFAVSADTGAPGGADDAQGRLKRFVLGLVRVRAVDSVSFLVRPPSAGAGGRTLDAGPAARMPTVEVDAEDLRGGGPGLLPDRLYLVSAGDEDAGSPHPPGRLPRPAPRALPRGDGE